MGNAPGSMHGNMGPEDDPNFVDRQILEAKLQEIEDLNDQIHDGKSAMAVTFGDKSEKISKENIRLSQAALKCVAKLKIGCSVFHEQFDRYMISQSHAYLQLGLTHMYAKEFRKAIKYFRLCYDTGVALCGKTDYYVINLAPCVYFLGKTYLEEGIELEDAHYWARIGRHISELYFEMKHEEPSCHLIKEEKRVAWCECSGGHEYVNRFHLKNPESEARRLRQIMEFWLTNSYDNFFVYYWMTKDYRTATEFGCKVLARYRSIHPNDIEQSGWLKKAFSVLVICTRSGAFKQSYHLLGAISMQKCSDTDKEKLERDWVEFGAMLLIEAVKKFIKDHDLPDDYDPFDSNIERWTFFQTIMEEDIDEEHFLLPSDPLASHEEIVELIAKIRSWNVEGVSENFATAAETYEELYEMVKEKKQENAEILNM